MRHQHSCDLPLYTEAYYVDAYFQRVYNLQFTFSFNASF